MHEGCDKENCQFEKKQRFCTSKHKELISNIICLYSVTAKESLNFYEEVGT